MEKATKKQILESSTKELIELKKNIDCDGCSGCLRCLECLYCLNSTICENCKGCEDCAECTNCQSCSGCFGCTNCSCSKLLRDKSYMIANVQFTKEEYESWIEKHHPLR